MEQRFTWLWLGLPLALLGAGTVLGAPGGPASAPNPPAGTSGPTVGAIDPGSTAAGGPKPAPVKGAAPVGTPSGEPGTVTIRNSPQGRVIYDDNKGVARMTRDVRVTQVGEDFILYADDLTYNRPRNQAIATGNLRVETRDSTIRAKRLFADFNQKTITFYDDVVIASHGEKDGIQGSGKGLRTEILHKPSVLNCDRAIWDYELREGKATGNIEMRQAENLGTCERITFNERQNVALLEGTVRFTDGKRRTLHCNDLTVYIDADKVESRQPCTIRFPRETGASPTPGPTKAPAREFGPAPEISPEDLKAFEMQDPIPTPAAKRNASEATPGVNSATTSVTSPAPAGASAAPAAGKGKVAGAEDDGPVAPRGAGNGAGN